MPNMSSNNEHEVGAIMNSLPGRAMRVAMENKDMLTGKGAMYAGTNEVNEVTVTGMDDGSTTYSVRKTAAVAPPSDLNPSANNPFVLVYTGEGATGVVWMSWNQLKNLTGH